MSYIVRSEYLGGDVSTEHRHDTVITQDGKECVFECDANNPALLSTVLDGKRVSLVASIGKGSDMSISLRGYTYPVTVLSERDQYFQRLLKETATAQSGMVKVPAPMPGLIKLVAVENGRTVKKGERLFILEAMKMENDIKAPADGIVTHLSIAEGAAVEKNFVLCILEPATQQS